MQGQLNLYMSFPEHEHGGLRARLVSGKDIFTTRISKEKGRYQEGQVVNSPFGELQVVNVQSGQGKHPFDSELTEAQLREIGEHPFDLVRLRK